MTAAIAVAALGLASLTGQWLHYRPDVRAHLRAALVTPVLRRGHSARRSLAALRRGLSFRLYRPAHAPTRRTQP
ncbi:hypothetical protein [Nonomuraea turcica]|uniref:hypothetical protein n=1 Tax=Nonomuraea sp. G32 TaxID=3067274 RepID=UPI00273CDC42|nr:hypothetical protein [Nonomuraea sp. G32]MDP4501016.1 hypothetical protein [Nonomuraea sp. G32]